mmetsp:Transcript_12786/g.24305  ORF Transcript_12786/g.24305 Transcript_12786/m.24305 type:complete len:215 (-) Transcript_12786:126-770(-)|eukprot:scaffold44519_cov214-Amphora_coffeaeformis.AAC.4
MKKEKNFSAFTAMNSSLEADIILGRGTVHAKHPGNKRFYCVVDTFLPLYSIAGSKSEKTVIIKLIFDTISASGQRFLIEEPSLRSCMEISEDQARKKIGHTLRYRQKLLNPASRAKSIATCYRASHVPSPTMSTPGIDSIPVVSAPSSPTRSPLPPKRIQVEIISDEELDSVLGLPGEMDLQDESSSPFVLQPLMQCMCHQEFECNDLDPFSAW